MSTNNIVPDSSQLTDPSYGLSPAVPSSTNVSQTPPAVPDAPASPPTPPSRLGAILTAVANVQPKNASAPSASSGGVASTNNDDQDPSSSGGSGGGFRSALGKAASVISTGLSGISDKGRPGFIQGLGSGARADQAAQAAAQAIKFQSFQDSVRATELHNDDLRLQNQTDQQQNANQKEWMERHDWLSDHGYDDFTVPNHGPAVINHLAAETSANGAVSVTPGTGVNPDGNTIHVPTNTQDTRDAQKQMFDTFGPIYGISRDPNQDFVPGKQIDILQHMMQGKNPDGTPINHDNLPGMIASYQTQLAALGGKATDAQKNQLQNTIGILQANQKALDDHAASVKQQGEQATLNAQNSPESIAGAAKKAGAVANAELPAKQALQQNAQDVKPVKPTNTDWVSGVSADEKKKAELAENIAFNANAVASTIMKRPDILGAVAGRFTNVQQMIGNNDPDISALGVHIHNMAMANSGVHGFRSQEGVESYEKQLLNNFKNGPAAMAGALNASTGSVQTFIDNARPEAYKTHSKQGGAVRGMMGVQQ